MILTDEASDVQATVRDLTNANPLDVTINDASGNAITDFSGGGVEYTEGDIDATITGTAILWEDAADTLTPVSAAKPLPISDAGGSLTVDGTVAVSSVTTSVTPGTAAANLGKAEDGGHTTGDVGVMALAVRNDTPGALAGTDLDYAPLQVNAAGGLRVDGSAVTQPVSGTVTANAGTGTFTVDASGTPVPVTDNGGSLTVDGTVTANAGTGTFTVDQADSAVIDYDTGAGTVNQTVIGIALPGSGGPVAGGTATDPVRTDPTGTTTQPVSGTVTANAGTGTFTVGDGGGSLTVDGTVAVSGTVTVDTELPTAVPLVTGTAGQTAPFVGAALFGASGGDTWNSLLTASNLGDASIGGQSLPAFNFDFNGSTWFRRRGNVNATLLASAARTTTQTSADILTYNTRGVTVILDVTAIVDTPSLTVDIQGKDPASGKYYSILLGAAVAAVSTNVYKIMPGITDTSGLSASQILPATIRIVINHDDSDSATYSGGYNLHV